jgi:hypothetical protein
LGENLSDVLELLGTGTYVVTRPGAESFVAGVRVAGVATTFSISASIQPMTGLELDRLPDGFRNSEAKACWTATALHTLDSAMPDTVLVGGLQYQVQSVEDWSDTGAYYRAVLVRPAL